jgi:hypothetical protein
MKVVSPSSKTFPLVESSLHNFFLDVSSTIDIVEIVKENE